jgi:hypothetical protein
MLARHGEENLMSVGRTNRRALIATLGGVFSMFLGLCAAAQDGHYGVDHDKWHHEFYATLKRKDGSRMPCCSQNDCRPTQSRMVANHYEVKVDGRWLSVPEDTIIDVIAPDALRSVTARGVKLSPQRLPFARLEMLTADRP